MHFVGEFVVQHRYRIKQGMRDEFLSEMAEIRDHADEMGVADWLLLENEEDRHLVTEMMAFDSWAHFQRLQAKAPDADVARLYERIGTRIEGGWDGVETTQWLAAPVPQ